MTDPGMKCSRCKGPAQHRFPQHNARFCGDCLAIHLKHQVAKAIKKFRMLEPGQRVVVAVSGGKDSLALWKLLLELDYEVQAVHLSLDLGEFSQKSLDACQAMAERLENPLRVIRLKDLAGYSVEEIVRANRREFCSVCGTLKRRFLNQVVLEMGASVVATGHHLDDEAGRLLGNMIRGHQYYIDRQWPVLEGMDGRLAKKIKPLCRLDGSEIKAYAKSQDLPAAYGKCPRSKGATLTYYQKAVQYLEEQMPGTKRDLYFGHLRRKGQPPPPPIEEGACSVCGQPSHAQVCTACLLIQRARNKYADPDTGGAGQPPDEQPDG